MMRVRFSRVLAGREELGDGDNARAPAFSPGLPRSSPGDWGDPGRATTLLIPQRELIPAVYTRAGASLPQRWAMSGSVPRLIHPARRTPSAI